jgi:hypothetical protein
MKEVIKRRILRDSRPSQYRLSESHQSTLGQVVIMIDQLTRVVRQVIARQGGIAAQLDMVAGAEAILNLSNQIKELKQMVGQAAQAILDKIASQDTRLKGLMVLVQNLVNAANNPDDAVALEKMREILSALGSTDADIAALEGALNKNTPEEPAPPAGPSP